jgi:hypothetical protein
MRFMMFMYPSIPAEADWTPDLEAVAAMGRFNEELTQAGILLALDGLHPESEGAKVTFEGGVASVIDGPFSEAKEVIGGYWLIDVADKAEAIEWAKRVPVFGDESVVVRRVFEMSDFPQEMQDAGALSETPPQQTSA